MGSNFIYFIGQHAFLSQEMTNDEVRYDFITESPIRLKGTTMQYFKEKKYSNAPYYCSVLDSCTFRCITVQSWKLKISKLIKFLTKLWNSIFHLGKGVNFIFTIVVMCMLFLSSDFSLNYTSALAVKDIDLCWCKSGQAAGGSAHQRRKLVGGYSHSHRLSFAVVSLKGLTVADC